MSDTRLAELSNAIFDATARMVAADTEEEFEKLYDEYKRLEGEFMREWWVRANARDETE